MEVKDKYFLTIQDIRKLYSLSYEKAKKVFDICNEIEDEELKEYRIETKKIRKKTVAKLLKV